MKNYAIKFQRIKLFWQEEEKIAGTSFVFLSALKTIEVPEEDFWSFFGELVEQVC